MDADEQEPIIKDGLYLVAAGYANSVAADKQADIYRSNGREVQVKYVREHRWSIWSVDNPD